MRGIRWSLWSALLWISLASSLGFSSGDPAEATVVDAKFPTLSAWPVKLTPKWNSPGPTLSMAEGDELAKGTYLEGHHPENWTALGKVSLGQECVGYIVTVSSRTQQDPHQSFREIPTFGTSLSMDQTTILLISRNPRTGAPCDKSPRVVAERQVAGEVMRTETAWLLKENPDQRPTMVLHSRTDCAKNVDRFEHPDCGSDHVRANQWNGSAWSEIDLVDEVGLRAQYPVTPIASPFKIDTRPDEGPLTPEDFRVFDRLFPTLQSSGTLHVYAAMNGGTQEVRGRSLRVLGLHPLKPVDHRSAPAVVAVGKWAISPQATTYLVGVPDALEFPRVWQYVIRDSTPTRINMYVGTSEENRFKAFRAVRKTSLRTAYGESGVAREEITPTQSVSAESWLERDESGAALWISREQRILTGQFTVKDVFGSARWDGKAFTPINSNTLVPTRGQYELLKDLRRFSEEDFKSFEALFPKMDPIRTVIRGDMAFGDRIPSELSAVIFAYSVPVYHAIGRFNLSPKVDGFLVGSEIADNSVLLLFDVKDHAPLGGVIMGQMGAGGYSVQSVLCDVNRDGALDWISRVIYSGQPSTGAAAGYMSLAEFHGDGFDLVSSTSSNSDICKLFDEVANKAGRTISQKGRQVVNGKAYAVGSQVPKNPALAFQWYLRAAKKGSVSAQTEVGQRYLSGAGVAKDEPEAFKWLQKAWTHGDRHAFDLIFRICQISSREKPICEVSHKTLASWLSRWWINPDEGVTFYWNGDPWVYQLGRWIGGDNSSVAKENALLEKKGCRR